MNARIQQSRIVQPVRPEFTPPRSGLLQRKCECGGDPGVDGECGKRREKRLQLSAAASQPANPTSSHTPPIVSEVLRSPGNSLASNTRASMEPRFGHDFSRVQVAATNAELTADAPDDVYNAYTLIHENAHRALQETYGHAWEGRFNNCDAGPPVGKFYNDNPSSYGCFAYEAFKQAAAAAAAPAPAPGPGPAPAPAPSGPVQRLAMAEATPLTAPPIVESVLSSTGHPLGAVAQSYFEPRFGHDFSRVRIHTGVLAAESAKAVNARAYTVGSHVVFNANEYSPDTSAGRKLLAHELAHVVQQSNYRYAHIGRKGISSPGDALEVAAEKQAVRATSTTEPTANCAATFHSSLSVPTLQRYPVPGSLQCTELAGWMDSNSPYKPEWAQTNCDYAFNGDLKVSPPKQAGAGVSVTATGHNGLTVSVDCDTDLPEWSPSGREGRTKQLLAWQKMITVLKKHEDRHKGIGAAWKPILQGRFRAANVTAAGADKDEAMANLSQKLAEKQQQWIKDAQDAQNKIDPFRDAHLVCPEAAGAEEIAPQPSNIGNQVPPAQPVPLGANDTAAQPKPLSPELQQLFP